MGLLATCGQERSPRSGDEETPADTRAAGEPDSSAPADDSDRSDAGVSDADGSDEVQPFDLTGCAVVMSDRIPLPEASGVAPLDPAGDRLLITADSGNDGRALIIDRARDVMHQASLPLGEGAGDDIEGLSRAPDGRIFGLSSSGWLRAWRESESGFELIWGPREVSADPDWACDPFGVNCGPNYEGLCLHPAPAGATGCLGYAASKAHGELVCLVSDGGDGYRVDPDRRIGITGPGVLSGCAFEPNPPHRLIAAGNLYSGSALWIISDEEPPVELAERGAANQEALLLAPDGELQSFGDAQDLLADASPRTIFSCSRAAP